MKVLQINCVYPNGSTGKLTDILHSAHCRLGEESVVFYGRGARIRQESVYKTCPELFAKVNNAMSRIRGTMYGGCWVSTKRLISSIRRENPDIVHLQCINGYFVNIYSLISWLKKEGIPTVLTLHAEFMYTGNCGYALDCENWRTGCGNCPRLRQETKSLFWDRTAESFCKMQKAFYGFDEKLVVVSVSPWLMERAKQSLILENKRHVCIYNGVDIGVFHYRRDENLRRSLCKENERIIFHATASFTDSEEDRKGGIWLLRLAEQMKDEPVHFIVAGPHDVSGEIPSNVTLLGQVRDQELLAKYYSIADVTLLVSKKETFSMITAESLCCGTPVVGFRAGAPEQIAIPAYSSFVEQEDLIGLKEAIHQRLVCIPNKLQVAQEAGEVYSSQTMVDNYERIYRELDASK